MALKLHPAMRLHSCPLQVQEPPLVSFSLAALLHDCNCTQRISPAIGVVTQPCSRDSGSFCSRKQEQQASCLPVLTLFQHGARSMILPMSTLCAHCALKRAATCWPCVLLCYTELESKV
jgi:hypothetical protein